MPRPDVSSRSGLLFAVAAYVLWGALPLYMVQTVPTTPVEVIGWRILASIVFCALLVTLVRGWRRVGRVFRDRRTVVTLGGAGLLVAVNWLLYVYAVMSGHTIEGALGYFLNPLISIFLGLVVLGERLRRLQWIAVALAAIGVVVLAVGYGVFPWIALGLATSFGCYGLLKKQLGARLDALPGLFVETSLLTPVALACLAWTALLGGGVTFGALGWGHFGILLLLGPVTSVPLLLFAAAAKRLTLVQIALLQYLAPTIQFVIGVLVLGEAMPAERWIGFAFVWFALAVFSLDLVVAQRRSRALPSRGD